MINWLASFVMALFAGGGGPAPSSPTGAQGVPTGQAGQLNLPVDLNNPQPVTPAPLNFSTDTGPGPDIPPAISPELPQPGDYTVPIPQPAIPQGGLPSEQPVLPATQWAKAPLDAVRAQMARVKALDLWASHYNEWYSSAGARQGEFLAWYDGLTQYLSAQQTMLGNMEKTYTPAEMQDILSPMWRETLPASDPGYPAWTVQTEYERTGEWVNARDNPFYNPADEGMTVQVNLP